MRYQISLIRKCREKICTNKRTNERMKINNALFRIFYSTYLINLWFPSMCHKERGALTWYWRLFIVFCYLCITPVGSVLLSDEHILALWMRWPRLWRCPLSILIPISGLSFWARMTMLSSCSSFILLKVPIVI